MFNNPSTPDERIELGVQCLKTAKSFRSAEDFVAPAYRRRALRRMRVGLGTGLSLAAGLCVAGYLLLPQRAMASLNAVLDQSNRAAEFMAISHSWNQIRDSEMKGITVTWRRQDYSVMRTSTRICDHRLNPARSLSDAPLDESTLWMERSGGYVAGNARCRQAVSFQGLPFVFGTSMKVGDWLKVGKLVHSTAHVFAHGGAFDQYVIQTAGSPGEPMTSIVYADPQSHRIRFVDQPLQESHELTPTADKVTNQWVMAAGPRLNRQQATIEFRYPDQTGLWQNPPPTPKASETVSSDAVKARFLAEIAQPVASVEVGGIKKTLYGVVIEKGGEVVAITTGGAPRDEADPHELQVLDRQTWHRHSRAPYIGNHQRIGKRVIVLPVSIGGRSYIAEASRSGLLAPRNPSALTIRVPVWKYDRTHPLANLPGLKPSVFYPSVFVGYATFTTTKIYEMPGGFANANSGASLPSDY
ncbi:MAG: hypothetical protein P4L46_14130 [Fimbriimonas sp.]|nr:hypothetical protein [Fimbriimonas sp.]